MMVNPDKLLRILGEVHKNSGQKRTLEREEKDEKEDLEKIKTGTRLVYGYYRESDFHEYAGFGG